MESLRINARIKNHMQRIGEPPGMAFRLTVAMNVFAKTFLKKDSKRKVFHARCRSS